MKFLFQLTRWLYHFPLLVSFALFITQLLNTGILLSYSREFTKLRNLLEDYMNNTEAISRINNDVESGIYEQAGLNAEHFSVIDQVPLAHSLVLVWSA